MNYSHILESVLMTAYYNLRGRIIRVTVSFWSGANGGLPNNSTNSSGENCGSCWRTRFIQSPTIAKNTKKLESNWATLRRERISPNSPL